MTDTVSSTATDPIYRVTCLRCGHVWPPKSATPVKCPRCQTPYWNKPRLERRPGLVRRGEGWRAGDLSGGGAGRRGGGRFGGGGGSGDGKDAADV